MINFVLIIVVFELTKSNTAVSGVVLAYTIPAIVFGVVAGVLVDYWNKRDVLFVTNIVRLVLLVLLALLHTNVIIVLTLSFAVSIATQFFIPAETPIIPLIVKKDQLLAANAFFGIGVYGSALVAYALSGPLLIFFGKTNVFFFLAAFFGIAALFVRFIILPKSVHDPVIKTKMNISGGVAHALVLVYKRRDIFHSLFLLTMSQIIILILGVVGPSYANNILRIGVEQFPLLFITPAALGMVVGAVILIRFFSEHSKVILANSGVFLSGGIIFVLPYARIMAIVWEKFLRQTHLPVALHADILHIVIVLAFLLGFANALVFVPSNTIVQEETHEDVRGKVYGVLNALIGIFSLLPVILAGTLTDAFGVFHVLQGVGVIIFVIGIWRIIFLEVTQGSLE
jgi:MFS family permease